MASEQAPAQLYWEAVQALLAGDEGAAHAALRALGCRFALAPSVWARCREGVLGGTPAAGSPSASSASTGVGTGGSPAAARPWVHDRALPPCLAARLQEAFAPGAAYWREHAYADPDTPFFSYVFPVPGERSASGIGTGGSGARPATLLEAAAVLLARGAAAHAHCSSGVADSGAAPLPVTPAVLLQGATHVEFWAHVRPPDAPHQLHFDVNEGLLRRGRAAFKLLHPAASSVLFLTGAGGPTLVLAQTPQGPCGVGGVRRTPHAGAAAAGGALGGCSPAGSGGVAPESLLGGCAALWAPLNDSAARHLAPCGWLLRPRPGRAALWAGNLAHCVLPGALTADAEEAEAACEAPGLQPQLAASGAPEGGAPGSAGGSASCLQERVTLILAWWRGDPRGALPADDGSCSGSEGGVGDGSSVEGDGAGGGRGGAHPRALMRLPPVGEHAPVWVQDVALREGEWDEFVAHAQAAGSAGSGSARQAAGAAGSTSCSTGWRPADECVSPCWVRVAPGPSDDTACAACPVAEAPLLPPLRYFLPAADAISAAYGQV